MVYFTVQWESALPLLLQDMNSWHSKKISSLTLKTFGPEVTVCYPVKRNKCMSDLEKCWELNCIKALSLLELQSNWIKLEKQLQMCRNPFFPPPLHPHVLFHLDFCPCQHSTNEIPKMRRWALSAESKHHQADTPLTPACWLTSLLFLSLLKLHIGISSCHSTSLVLSLSQQPATQSASFNKDMHICKVTNTRRAIQTFLKTTCPCSFLLCAGWKFLSGGVHESVHQAPYPWYQPSPTLPPPTHSHCHYFLWCPPLICWVWVLALLSLLSLSLSSSGCFHLSGALLGDRRWGGLISHHA